MRMIAKYNKHDGGGHSDSGGDHDGGRVVTITMVMMMVVLMRMMSVPMSTMMTMMTATTTTTTMMMTMLMLMLMLVVMAVMMVITIDHNGFSIVSLVEVYPHHRSHIGKPTIMIMPGVHILLRFAGQTLQNWLGIQITALR